ncbi:GNAT family N-acetyltransferase [Candidatus Babeliales bacterium]|nr:GNAT family N-acetyltransferase [Candidatus Babeliales bacterium]MBP9844389.1 GNAT family N-acetyltransferase [Candidatus Babeliales bacterium]
MNHTQARFYATSIKLRIYVILSCVFAINLLASQEPLRLEIVRFDYQDVAMKEQWLSMVKDSQDDDMQKWMLYTDEEIEKVLSGSEQWFSLFVFRLAEKPSTIFGFIEYDEYDSLCFWKLPYDQGFWLSKESTNQDGLELVKVMKSVGFVNGIAVHKDYRGRGIAFLLLQYVEELCRHHGMEQLILFVGVDNDKAVRACTDYGFEICPEYSRGKGLTMKKMIQDE